MRTGRHAGLRPVGAVVDYLAPTKWAVKVYIIESTQFNSLHSGFCQLIPPMKSLVANSALITGSRNDPAARHHDHSLPRLHWFALPSTILTVSIMWEKSDGRTAAARHDRPRRCRIPGRGREDDLPPRLTGEATRTEVVETYYSRF